MVEAPGRIDGCPCFSDKIQIKKSYPAVRYYPAIYQSHFQRFIKTKESYESEPGIKREMKDLANAVTCP
jgi:hypothetical protein